MGARHEPMTAAPEMVYVLLRGDGTIAGVRRDLFEPPKSAPGGWRVVAYVKAPKQDPHELNVAGCCDGTGQVHHGVGALSYVTLCPNGCASKAWDEDCEQTRRSSNDAPLRKTDPNG